MSKIEEQIEAITGRWMRDTVYPRVRQKTLKLAERLIEKAIQYRESAPEKHDFTGNLLNSVVAVVYEDGKPIEAFFTKDKVNKPIARKMTRPNRYHRKVDYEGVESNYTPEIQTDKGKGTIDAVDFFSNYVPQNKAKFNLVVAYTTEYASWVEQFRHTTGFAWEYDYAKKYGWRLLNLPVSNGQTDLPTFAPF